MHHPMPFYITICPPTSQNHVEAGPMTPPPCKAGKLRPSWNSKAQFVLACVGLSVGVGNIARFPVLLYRHGGGGWGGGGREGAGPDWKCSSISSSQADVHWWFPRSRR